MRKIGEEKKELKSSINSISTASFEQHH